MNILTPKILRIMKKLIEIMANDYSEEGYTLKEWTAASVVVLALLALMGLCGWIESTYV